MELLDGSFDLDLIKEQPHHVYKGIVSIPGLILVYVLVWIALILTDWFLGGESGGDDDEEEERRLLRAVNTIMPESSGLNLNSLNKRTDKMTYKMMEKVSFSGYIKRLKHSY